jgi:hypothetical protein
MVSVTIGRLGKTGVAAAMVEHATVSAAARTRGLSMAFTETAKVNAQA